MAFYRTGTISLTNGSNAVIGAGTDFLLGASIGECVQAPDGKLYEILKINCAQGTTVVLGVTLPSIELGQPYLGATASGQPYSIVPTQSYIRDLASQAATLVNGYGDTKTNAILLTAADKATPVDTDKLAMRDSVSGLARMLTWANAKAALKTYFDSVATTLTNKTLTNPVINGGSVSGATGSFTTLSASNATTPSVYVTDRITIGGNGINNPSGYNISGTAYGGAIELRTNSATFDRGFRFGIRNNSDGFVPTLSFIETDPTVRVTKPVAITGSVSPSQGVKFPAAQYSSADPNTLDDYEEGTFTPTLRGTTAGEVNFYGYYTKIGNVVFIKLKFGTTIPLNALTGNLYITGLPFSAGDYVQVGLIHIRGSTTTAANAPFGIIGGTSIQLHSSNYFGNTSVYTNQPPTYPATAVTQNGASVVIINLAFSYHI